MKRRGADIITDQLRRGGIKHVFALCGHGNIGLLDALYEAQPELTTVSVHHEQVAGHMADAYFRIKGVPAATLTSSGPGSANLPVALASAMMDSSAVLAITGNVPTQQFNRDPFQETGRHYQADFPGVLRPYVKRSFQPTRPEQLPLVLRQAMVLLKQGRPGPVHIDVPLNLFLEETEEPTPDPQEFLGGLTSASGASAESIGDVVDLIRGCERPVLLAGGGVFYHRGVEEFQRLAESTGIPVICSPDANGVLPTSHPLMLGPIGRNGTYAANEAARNADVVVSLSCLLDDRMTSAWIDGFTFSIPPTKLIQVDIDERELSKNYPATLGVLANPATFSAQLKDALDGSGYRVNDPWRERLDAARRQWNEDVSPAERDERFPAHPQRVIAEIRGAVPGDAMVLSDVGIHHNWLVQFWDTEVPGTFHQSWGFAAMGFGVAGVLGAKLARPDVPAVTICGDAGFTMVSSAVLTAVEYGIPAVWVVWDNQAYGSIRDMQYGFFEGRELATAFYKDGQPHSPDFAALARSFGANGITVSAPGDIGDAVSTAIASERPTVVHVPTAGDVHPIATGGWVLPPLDPIRPTYRFDEG
jgi:acetolactate synthase-1/2/3 large subunit